MPMKLLARLSRETLPASVTESKDVFNLHILKATGHVNATIPLPHCSPDGHWHRDPATVRQVTPLGCTVLRLLGSTGSIRPANGIAAVAIKPAHADPSAFRIPPEKDKMT